MVKILLEKEVMTTMSIRIAQEEKETIQNLAKELDLSASHLVRKAIKEFILANKAKEEVGSDK